MAADRSIRNSWILLLAPFVLVMAAAGGLYAWLRHKPSAGAAPPAKIEALPPPAAGAEVSFSGQVQARNVLPVAAPIEGTLESVDAETGTSVAEGQLLGRIRNDGLESARQTAQQDLDAARDRVSNFESGLIAARLEVSRAGADAERARTEADRLDRLYKREEMLFREGATARLKYEKAQKDAATAKSEEAALRTMLGKAEERVKSSQHDLDMARRAAEEKERVMEDADFDLKAAEVRSPVDGVLLSVRVKVGEQVELSMDDLFQVGIALEELHVPIDPDPAVQARLKDGLPALVQVLELGGEGIAGELKQTEAGGWRVEFKAGDPAMKPGLAAVVKVKLP